MACGQNCEGCSGCGGGLGAYRSAPPLAFAAWRLRVPGNPPGGQYHGYLGAAPGEAPDRFASPWDFFNPGHYSRDGVYRSPGEVPPKANPNGDANTFVVRHSRRRAGYSVVPGAFSHLGAIDCSSTQGYELMACSAAQRSEADALAAARAPVIAAPVPISNIRYPVSPFPINSFPVRYFPIVTGSTQPVLQPPPSVSPQPAPVVQDAAPPPTMYRDAAGNWTSDWHNPYSLYLPESVQIQPAPIVSADTSFTPGAGQTSTALSSPSVQGNAVTPSPSWFTDPSKELISGVPNWGILAAAAAAFFLLKGRR